MSTAAAPAASTPLDDLRPGTLDGWDLTRGRVEAALAELDQAGLGADLHSTPVLEDVFVDLRFAQRNTGHIQSLATDAIRDAFRGLNLGGDKTWVLTTVLNAVQASMMSASSGDHALSRLMQWVNVEFADEDEDY